MGQQHGFESGQDYRPGDKVEKKENLIPDENGNLVFAKNDACNLVRNNPTILIYIFSRTFFQLHSLPRALPRANRFWPFRP